MKFFKKNILIILIITLGSILRLDNLFSLMQFIPDQGWFYLSARDMLLTGHVPLVGPPTSHPWIHHGPLWTYTLALIFYFSRFNPVVPAYVIAILGVFTVWIFYKAGSRMFGRRTGFIASLLFATSPLIVMNARIPYHTSPIPFFTILLFYLTFLWVNGKRKAFPIISFLLAVLYNHEITTSVFGITILLIFGYGLYKHKKWALKTLDLKILLVSGVLFLIPMIPFILYDTHHGYKQTFGFVAWMGYRIVKFPLSIFDKSFVSGGSNPATITEFLTYYQELTFVSNFYVSAVILISSVGYFLYILRRKITPSYILLGLFLGVGLIGLFLHRIPIEADTLLVAPFFILVIAVGLDRLMSYPKIKPWATVLFAVLVALNSYTLIDTQFFTKPGVPFFRPAYYTKVNTVLKVVQLANGKAYNIVGKGELSDFPVFLDPYKYLLWYAGYPVSARSEKTKIQIWEKGPYNIVTKIK